MKINLENMQSGENKLSFSGDAGNIEAILHLPKDGFGEVSRGAMMVCCHPHPLFGGTMTNKVVHTVCRTFSRMGLPALRFNFRGVGETEGEHDNGAGEADDLLLLCQAMRETWPDRELWLAGFSFGSWVAAHSAVAAGAKQLISIAPPVQHFNFNSFPLPECPWLVIMGEEDEIVDPDSVFNWIEAQDNPPELIKFPATGHFFHGHMVNLGKVFQQHYQPLLSGNKDK